MRLNMCASCFVALIAIPVVSQTVGAPFVTNVSSLVVVNGQLFAGTFSGQVYVSPDTARHWNDISEGLCDQSRQTYQKMVKCLDTIGNDSLRAVTACGEFACSVHDLRWVAASSDSCQLLYCPQCLACPICSSGLGYSASVGVRTVIAEVNGSVTWSEDGGETRQVAVPACHYCSMPIIVGFHFDSASAVIGLYPGYSGMIGFQSGIIASSDSGRTWHDTDFPELGSGITSFARIGDILFAGSSEGIYASRDNFATWWRLDGTAVKKRPAGVRKTGHGTSSPAHLYTLTGRKLRDRAHSKGRLLVIQCRSQAEFRIIASFPE